MRGIRERCEAETNGQVHKQDIIADITGGNKIMSVGASLACLDADRSIEYMEQQDRKTLHETEITWEKIVKRARAKGD